jgi:hypothetical protein
MQRTLYDELMVSRLGAQPEQPVSKQAPAPFALPAGTPAPERPATKPSFLDELKYGFVSEVASAVQALKNVVGGLDYAAQWLSRRTGEPVPDSAQKIKDFFERAQESLQAPPVEGASAAERVGRAVLRGIGSAPVAIAEYGLATLATRNPLAAFAIVDAAKHAHEGPVAAIRSGLVGAAVGGTLGRIAEIPSVALRAAGSGATMAAGSVLSGDVNPESLTSSAITGAVLGAVGMPGKKRAQQQAQPQQAQSQPQPQPKPGLRLLDPEQVISPETRYRDAPPARVNERTISGITVRGPDPSLPPLAGWIMSPHVWTRLVPEAQDAVLHAVLAERYTGHAQNMLRSNVLPAIKWLKQPEFERLVSYLDDPQYTLDNLPKDSPKIVEAYKKVRETLNFVRDKVRETNEKVGEPAPYDWGFEEGYFPHKFSEAPAYWRITADGEPIPNGWLATSRAEAVKKASEYRMLNPDGPKPVIEFVRSRPGEIEPVGPGRKYWGAKQRREGTEGWLTTKEALLRYLDEAARYIYYAPLRLKLQEATQAIEAAYPNSKLAAEWQRYATQQVEYRPGLLTKAMNDWLQDKGFGPDSVQRALGFVRATESFLKLGYSPVTALVNSFQVPVNLYPVLGAKWTWRGYKGFWENIKTGKYDWLLERLAVRDAVTKADEVAFIRRLQQEAPASAKELPGFIAQQNMALGMWMFSNVEYSNHAIAAIGAFERARAQGLSVEQAARKALEVDVRTQFSIGQADAMRILANPWSRTALQLKSFWAKQLEFMTGLARKDEIGRFDPRWKEVGRFLMATVAASGLAGLPGMATLDWFIKQATGYSLLDKLLYSGDRAQRALRSGLPTAVGVDISQNVGFGDWFSWQGSADPFGPALKDIYRLGQVAAAPPGRLREQQLQRFWRGLSPEMRRIYDAVLSDASKRGELLDVYNRPTVTGLTGTEKALIALGITPERVTRERLKYSKERQDLLSAQSEEQGYVDRIVKLMQAGDQQGAVRLAQEAVAKGHFDIWQSAKRRLKTVSRPRIETQRKRGQRFGIGAEDQSEE